MQELAELLDFSRMTREQLVDMCRVLFFALQSRDVTVNIQPAPQPYTFTIPPYPSLPYVGDLPGLGGSTSLGGATSYGGSPNFTLVNTQAGQNQTSAQGPVTDGQ
jgi:hypothetical protein